MTTLGVAALTAACWSAGHWLLARGSQTRSGSGGLYTRTMELMAGLVAFHLLLTLLQLVGIPWRRGTLLAIFALFLLPSILALRAVRGWTPRRPALGWGDAVAILATLLFAVAAVALRATTPDFVYHFGIKAKKFLLAGGVDFDYLARPWNHFTHPDYPNLLPELFATAAALAGRFDEAPLMLVSPLFFGLLLVAVREVLGLRLADGNLRQAGLAVVALATGAFALGHLAAGGADLLLAVALTAALPPLLEPLAPGAALRLGTAAAFAAAVKIEGVPLAVFLGLLFLAARWHRGALSVTAGARALLPPALVALPWAVASWYHGLFLETNVGRFEPERLGEILGNFWWSLTLPAWHGFPLVLFALPLLLARRASRTIALVVTFQLGLYVYIYLTASVDAAVWIRTSFPRLLLHLVPATLAAVFVALGSGPTRHQPRPLSPKSPAGGW